MQSDQPRILIVAPNLLYGAPNPRSIRARRLADGLAGAGFDVEVVTFWSGQEPAQQRLGRARLLAITATNPLAGWAARPDGWGLRSRPRRILHRFKRAVRGDRDGLLPWRRAVLEALAERTAGEAPDVIYAIGVPTGALTAGEHLSDRLGKPLIVDLGDPWVAGGRAEKRERSRTMGAAAALVSTTAPLAAELGAAMRPGAETLVAPNGGELREREGSHDPPLFVHLGVINHPRVDPGPAYEVLGELHRAGRIEFRSHSSGWRAGFDDLPHPHLPMVPHAEALDLLAQSAAVVIFGNHNHTQIPSKTFETGCTETWALCVSELEDDPVVAELTRTGHAVRAANDRAAIRAAIEEILAREERGERPAPEPEFSWDARIEQIASLIERVGGDRKTGILAGE